MFCSILEFSSHSWSQEGEGKAVPEALTPRQHDPCRRGAAHAFQLCTAGQMLSTMAPGEQNAPAGTSQSLHDARTPIPHLPMPGGEKSSHWLWLQEDFGLGH